MRISYWSSDVCSSDLLQPARRLERLAIDAVTRAVIVEPRDPEPVVLVRSFDRQAQLLGENARLPAIVDMPVSAENLLQRHPGLGHDRKSVEEGRRVSVSVELGGGGINKKKKKT